MCLETCVWRRSLAILDKNRHDQADVTFAILNLKLSSFNLKCGSFNEDIHTSDKDCRLQSLDIKIYRAGSSREADQIFHTHR